MSEFPGQTPGDPSEPGEGMPEGVAASPEVEASEWITLNLDILVAVSDPDALRSAAFHAMRDAAPGEDGIEQAVLTGEDTAAALGGFLAAVPGSVILDVPGVTGWQMRQVQATRPMTARERLQRDEAEG